VDSRLERWVAAAAQVAAYLWLINVNSCKFFTMLNPVAGLKEANGAVVNRYDPVVTASGVFTGPGSVNRVSGWHQVPIFQLVQRIESLQERA